ncbi:MAG: HD domain-containing phosphohydrolase [Myxococcota bacterium]
MKQKFKLAKDCQSAAGERAFASGQAFDKDVITAWATGQLDTSTLHLEGDGAINPSVLRNELEALIEKSPDFQKLHAHPLMQKDFGAIVNRTQLPPEVLLHLAVMRTMNRHLFEKSLVGAWLSLLLAMVLEFDRKDTDLAWRAALLRDLGMLYADPEVASQDSKVRLDSVMRAEMQQHSQTGAEVLERTGRSELAPVAEIVLAHHERVDGSGYPRGIHGLDFLPVARIVALVDVVVAIRLRPTSFGDIQLADVIYVLLMDRSGFDSSIFDRFLALARGAASEIEDEDHTVFRRAQQLHVRSQLLQERVYEIDEKLRSRTLPKGSAADLRERGRRTFDILNRSGILDKEVQWWLKKVASGRDQSDAETMKEIELQQLEIARQLDRIEIDLSNGPDVLSFSDVANRRPT